MALTKIGTDGVKDDAVTTDKLANAINTERTANTAKVSTTINNNADNRVITGSGTANTLEGEANLTYNGTRLEVKTGDLAVTGAEGGDAQLRLTADEGDDGADYWRLESNASTNKFNLATYASGSWVNKFAMDTNGRIGILDPNLDNFDSSADDLVINGTANTGITINSGAATSTSEGNLVFAEGNGTGGSADGFRGAIQYKHGDDYMRFYTDNAERMRVDSSGRLLLGTTTEGHSNADDLTVASSADTGITIRSGTSSQSSLYFSDGTSGTAEYIGSVVYNHSTNSLSLATSGSNRLAIDSGGVISTKSKGANTPTTYEFNYHDAASGGAQTVDLATVSSYSDVTSAIAEVTCVGVYGTGNDYIHSCKWLCGIRRANNNAAWSATASEIGANGSTSEASIDIEWNNGVLKAITVGPWVGWTVNVRITVLNASITVNV